MRLQYGWTQQGQLMILFTPQDAQERLTLETVEKRRPVASAIELAPYVTRIMLMHEQGNR